MDELEILKKQWQTKEQTFPKLSYDDIHKMLLKKSSSIVKWIFIISIGEVAFWTIISFFVPESSKQFILDMGIKPLFLGLTILNYIVIAIFLYLFYKNYRSISLTNTVKELMHNILKTRKTVKYFVYYNIITTAVTLIAVNLYLYLNKEQLVPLLSETKGYNTLPPDQLITVFFVAQLIVGVLLIGFLLLFYRIIYGILLRRLKANYKELKKIEV